MLNWQKTFKKTIDIYAQRVYNIITERETTPKIKKPKGGKGELL